MSKLTLGLVFSAIALTLAASLSAGDVQATEQPHAGEGARSGHLDTIPDIEGNSCWELSLSNSMARVMRQSGKEEEVKNLEVGNKSLEKQCHADTQRATNQKRRDDEIETLYRNGAYADAARAIAPSIAGVSDDNLATMNNAQRLFTANWLTEQASKYRARNYYSFSDAFYGRALVIREMALGPDHVLVGQSLVDLAELYVRAGRKDEVERFLQRASSIQQKGSATTDATSNDARTQFVQLSDRLAGVYRSLGREPDAAALDARAAPLKNRGWCPGHPGLSWEECSHLMGAKSDN